MRAFAVVAWGACVGSMACAGCSGRGGCTFQDLCPSDPYSMWLGDSVDLPDDRTVAIDVKVCANDRCGTGRVYSNIGKIGYCVSYSTPKMRCELRRQEQDGGTSWYLWADLEVGYPEGARIHVEAWAEGAQILSVDGTPVFHPEPPVGWGMCMQECGYTTIRRL
jgi:hypothetical protein